MEQTKDTTAGTRLEQVHVLVRVHWDEYRGPCDGDTGNVFLSAAGGKHGWCNSFRQWCSA